MTATPFAPITAASAVPELRPTEALAATASASRRATGATLLAWLALALGACGGGGGGSSTPPTGSSQQPPGNQAPPVDPPAPPAIQEFSADRASYGIGDFATLTVRFTGGAGRIEPDVGPVANGAQLRTEALDSSRDYTLVVEAPAAGVVRRSLRLVVEYRDEYLGLTVPFRSAGHAATLADDGRVILTGGSRLEPAPSSAVDAYDPATGSFRRVGSLRNGRFGHTATRFADGRILVAGGVTANDGPWAELLDERTGETTPLAAPARRRLGHSATWLGGGRVLITGGAIPGESGPGADSAEIFDAATGEFRALTARMAMGRANHAATLMPDGRVLITGGVGDAGARHEFAEVFDPRTESFSAVGSIDETPRSQHAIVRLPDGGILVLGGESASTRPLRSVLRFDGTTLASSLQANLLRPRTLAAGVTSRDGRVFLFGGEAGDEPLPTETAESYSLAHGAASIASMPQPRSGHTTTRLRDGRILIAGGEDRTGTLIDGALLYR